MNEDLAGVVLAAGLGTRLRPLTDLRPKALCPVGQQTLLDHALGRLGSVGLVGAARVAVNVHAFADAMVAAIGRRATASVELPRPLGTAGALGLLRGWLAGRPALVTNADAYLSGSIAPLLKGWDRERLRLLVVREPGRPDFGPYRFAGASLLPATALAALEPVESGLYEVCWRAALERGDAELVEHRGTFIDCGTPADYLAANLDASGGRSVVGAGARVAGTLIRSVVWPGATVHADETLVDSIRADGGLTVRVHAEANRHQHENAAGAGPLGPGASGVSSRPGTD